MKPQKKLIQALIFAEGFLVLVLQINTSIVLSPYWGQTYYYWLYSLFLSMLGLAIGYFISPFLLKKWGEPLAVLRKIILILLFYFGIVSAFSVVILMFFLDFIENPLNGAILSLIVFFFLPTVLLAVVPMALIQYLKSQDADKEGVLSGRVFSLSATGGVVGVALVTYLVLPFAGIDAVTVLLLLGIVFMYFVVNNLLQVGKRKWTPILFAFIALLVLFSQKKSASNRLADNLEIVYDNEGILGKLTVLKNNTNQIDYLLVNNNIQSQAHFTGRSMNPYVYSVAMYASYFPKGSKVLIAGLGCGSLAYEFGQFGYAIDVVDIDKRLDKVVHDHFLVSPNSYHFKHSDARHYLKVSKKMYDVIVLDISHGENVPTNVYTLEGFQEVREHLSEGGLLLVHFLSAQTKEGKMALASVIHTMKKAGFDVEIMNFLNRTALFDDSQWGGNPEGFVLAAMRKKVDLHTKELKIDPSLLKEMHPNKEALYLDFKDQPVPQLLTDNLPILDLFHAETALKYRILSMKQLKEYYAYE